MKIWSRRKFIEAGVLGSIAVGSGAAAGISPAQDAKAGPRQGAKSGARQIDEENLLRAVIDELIPAGDEMPAASEVGSIEYLEKLSLRDATFAREIRQTLTAIMDLSKKRFQTSFTLLTQESKVAVLTALEKQDAGNFKVLCDSVYEAYYEQPQVWKLIDYTCYQTNGGGPAADPFHEEILSEVRKKPKGYREV